MVETVYFDGRIKGVNSGTIVCLSTSFEEAIIKLPKNLMLAPNGTLVTPRFELFDEFVSFPIVFIEK
ncbi:MAG: hypothetical protein AB7S72_12125 [Draconibacterium sp.]